MLSPPRGEDRVRAAAAAMRLGIRQIDQFVMAVARLGAICTQERAKDDPATLLFNRSQE
jgi:hypothetical protein